jgi:hypothetical protein
MRMPA